jgi:hypothetical protein
MEFGQDFHHQIIAHAGCAKKADRPPMTGEIEPLRLCILLFAGHGKSIYFYNRKLIYDLPFAATDEADARLPRYQDLKMRRK